MTPRAVRIAVTLTATLAPAVVWAQHEGHQATASQPPPQLAQCAQVQPAIENILTAAMMRLESARQSNDPAQLRAAVDHVQGALRDLRTQLAPCAAAGADPDVGRAMPPATKPPATPADPHAGHTMPPAAPPTHEVAKPPAAAHPHPGHKTPESRAAAPKTAKPNTAADPHGGHGAPLKKGSGAKPSKPPAATPHAGHEPGAPQQSPGKPTEKQMDPVTGLMVDPATAPKTTYQGQTYYFSSEASRKEFLENPAKFASRPKK